MKLFQTKEGIVTVGKTIVRNPLQNEIKYQLLKDLLKKDVRNGRWPETYQRDQIKSLCERVGLVLDGKYAKSGFSNRSAYTKGAHTWFWKDPDIIHEEGCDISISTKRLLSLGSGWSVNGIYGIDQLVDTKKELEYLLKLGDVLE